MKNLIRSQVRFPSDLHESLTRAASTSGRSLNEEIVTRLRATFSEVSASEAMYLGELQQQLAKLKLSDLMSTDDLKDLANRVAALLQR